MDLRENDFLFIFFLDKLEIAKQFEVLFRQRVRRRCLHSFLFTSIKRFPFLVFFFIPVIFEREKDVVELNHKLSYQLAEIRSFSCKMVVDHLSQVVLGRIGLYLRRLGIEKSCLTRFFGMSAEKTK